MGIAKPGVGSARAAFRNGFAVVFRCDDKRRRAEELLAYIEENPEENALPPVMR